MRQDENLYRIVIRGVIQPQDAVDSITLFKCNCFKERYKMIRRTFNILIVTLLTFTVIGMISVQAQATSTSTQVQIVHLALSTGAVDVYVSDKVAVSNLTYQSVSDPLTVTDSSLKLAVVAVGGKLTDATTLTVNLDPPGQPSYVIALVGSPKDGTFAAVVYSGTLRKAQIGTATVGTLTVSGAYVEATALASATAAPTADAMSGMGGMTVATPAATAAAMSGMDMASPAPTMAAMSGMAMSGPTSAVYLTISNSGDKADKLLSVTTDAAQKASVHQTVVTNNIAQMIAVDGGLDIPANGKVSFRPGGYHIMIENLTHDLIAGGTIKVTLTFQSGTVINLTVPIKQY
jgi:hypothetical protein